MATKLNDGAKILFDTINLKLRHQDYEWVKKIANDYTCYATGHGIDKKLKQFNGRESIEAFNQRVALTQCNTPDIFNSCVKPLYKVGRTPATINIAWEGKDAKETTDRKKKLLDAGKNFWGKKDVGKYVRQRMADLDGTDPNSFVIVEFKEAVDPKRPEIKANPYPFEANSAEAINYVYKNNELQWLIVLNGLLIYDKEKKSQIGEKYYTYLDNETITAEQIHADGVSDYLSANPSVIQITDYAKSFQLDPTNIYLFNTLEENVDARRYYIIKIFEHKIGFVPAKRFGTIADSETRGRTCKPLIFAAQSYFEKSIKTMSEFDLTNCLHTFPQKLQYSDPCPGEKTDHGWMGCQNGMRPDGKAVCGACQGSGFKVHHSAQDIIQIRMPKELNEIVSLENVLVYKHPPIDLLEFQKKFAFYELRQAAQGAVYNSDVFSRQEIAQTATSKIIDLDAVYDTLTPFADSWSEMYEHIYKCIASLRDIADGLILNHTFPNDFKMESFPMLLDNLQKANTSGAPSHVKKALNKKITHKMYIDEPDQILKIETKDKFYPFAGKTESEVNFILANDLTTKFNKIFYANFDLIFSDIEFDQGSKELDFYQMDEKMQRDIINKKVQEYIDKIDTEDAAGAANAFNSAPDVGGNGGASGPTDPNAPVIP